jgi:hypothetical protein
MAQKTVIPLGAVADAVKRHNPWLLILRQCYIVRRADNSLKSEKAGLKNNMKIPLSAFNSNRHSRSGFTGSGNNYQLNNDVVKYSKSSAVRTNNRRIPYGPFKFINKTTKNT